MAGCRESGPGDAATGDEGWTHEDPNPVEVGLKGPSAEGGRPTPTGPDVHWSGSEVTGERGKWTGWTDVGGGGPSFRPLSSPRQFLIPQPPRERCPRGAY